MVEQGYYSNRINELEERKAKVQGQLVTAKITLQGIDKEIAKCEDAMQNLGKQNEKEIILKNEKIKLLSKEITSKENKIMELNEVIKNKNLKIDELNSNLKRLDDLVAQVKAENIHLKAQIRGVNTILEDKNLMEQYKKFVEVI